MRRSRLQKKSKLVQRSRLKKPLDREFRMIIPVTTKADLNKIADKMNRHFGGITVLPRVEGYWTDAKGKVYFDKNMLLFATRDLDVVKNHEDVLIKDRAFMLELAVFAGKLTNQKGIWLEEDLIQDVQIVKVKL